MARKTTFRKSRVTKRGKLTKNLTYKRRLGKGRYEYVRK